MLNTYEKAYEEKKMALMKMSDRAETISESKEQTNLHENMEDEGWRGRNFLKLISYGELRRMWQEKQSKSQMKMEVRKQIDGLQEEFEDKVKEGHEKMVKKVRDFEKAIRQNRKEKQDVEREFQDWVKSRRDELTCKLYGKMDEKEFEKLKMDLSCGRVVERGKVVEVGEEDALKDEYDADVKEQLEELTKKKLHYYADEVHLRRCMQDVVKEVEEWISEQKKQLVEKVLALKNSTEKIDENESDLKTAQSKDSQESESKSEVSKQKPTTSKNVDGLNVEKIEASESTIEKGEESTETMASNDKMQKVEVGEKKNEKVENAAEEVKKENVEEKVEKAGDEVVSEKKEELSNKIKEEKITEEIKDEAKEATETKKVVEEKKETDLEVKTEQNEEPKTVKNTESETLKNTVSKTEQNSETKKYKDTETKKEKDSECTIEKDETDAPAILSEIGLKKVAASENIVGQKEEEEEEEKQEHLQMSRSERESRNMLDLSPKKAFLAPSHRYSHFYLPDPSTLEELKLLIPNPEEHPTLYNNLLIKIFFNTRSYESSNLSKLKKQRSWCDKLLKNCNKSQQKLTNDLKDLNKIAQSNKRTELYKNKQLQKMEEGLVEVRMRAIKLERMKEFMQQASSTMLQAYNTDLPRLEDTYKIIKLVGVRSVKRYSKKKFLRDFMDLVKSNEDLPKEIEKIENTNASLQQAVDFITDSYFIRKSVENFT